ncbi:MAG TPA: carboxypeptidase regulatory-like domain-containing protein, partial [Bryobacteraceae bacterium]|nr:carboxypeptidase regulatory-like domain-containing protein [Bryobacteraceae bacterium]
MKDQGGALVPKASVILTNEATGGKWVSETTSSGSFTIPELPAGVYDISVTYKGFKEYVQKGLTVKVGDTASLDVILQIGNTTETVEVHADVQQLKSETSDLGTTVQSQFAADLPLQVGGQVRSPMQFIALDPGFTGYTPNDPSNQNSFKLNGGQEGGSLVLVDGANVNLVSPNVQVNYAVGPDAIQEMKVMTSNFSAEYGRASGGVVNLVTKSGSNQLHGTAYEFLRNKALNSAGWWTNERGLTKGKDTQNDFGFQVAGPVWIPKLYDGRNKTFFMFNYEGYRYSSGGQNLLSAPLDAWNKGDFSSLLTSYTSPKTGHTLGARQLYDYTTCNAAGQNCQPFANNQIPAARMDKVFSNALPYLTHAQDQSAELDNLTETTSAYSNANTYTGKLDQYIGSRQKISAMWSLDDRPRGQDSSLGDIWTQSWGAQTGTYARLSHDYTISPTLLNHFNFGFSRRNRIEAQGLAGAGLPSKIGLTGVMDANFPAFEMHDSSWGGTVGPGNGNSQFVDNTYQVNDNVSWQHGRHSLKFGVELQRQQFNTRRFAYASGDFMFNELLTGNGDPNTGFAYASFYLGTFYSKNGAQVSQIPQGRAIGLRPRYWAGFVQDDFKVSQRLTLNLGLRYDLSLPTTEAHNRMSWMDPTVPNPGAGGLAGAYVFAGDGEGRTGMSSPQTAWKKAFGPRVGLAYSVDPKTVIRAGYGVYYSAIKVGGFADADAYGFTGSYTFPDPGNNLVPAGKLDQITSWPGKLPPFIDPTLQNGQGPSVILSKVARPGTIQNWTFDIQRQLAKDLMLDVAYVGNHADHLQSWMQDPNQLDPKYQSRGACLGVDIAQQATSPACAGQAIVPLPYAGFTGTVGQALRPFPQYSNATLDNSADGNPFGFSTHHALQTKLEKRFSAGLTLLGTFTWAKTLTNADSEYPGQAGWNNGNIAGFAQNQYNNTVEKSLSVQDVPRRLMLAYSYELPVGKGKRYLNKGGVVNAIVGGWNISGVQTYASGLPLSVLPNGSFNPGTFTSSTRANVVAGVDPKGAELNGSFDFYSGRVFNPGAFSQPENYTYGTAART